MIAQVDEALCRLLRPCLPPGTQLRLDPPKPAWRTESQVRSVELFLFALRGEQAAAGCTLSYLVTARAGEIDEEHRLLDAALHAVLDAEDPPVRLRLADTDATALWTSLGMPARAGFVLQVTAGG
ncbi:hypothetical protein [Amycolatopsis australiensis]|uniref:Uncharacterized protein n=1 Tax=Amycolatopsis australiensis TaxID=546364 RepID=A0A1K1P9B5_9PSEU|nr:hypothetical protein [Amycolatopsis australiensis]SFW43278.1 hypothetical protein SAMN04489730_0288 [Amycolatopsis australiensis]